MWSKDKKIGAGLGLFLLFAACQQLGEEPSERLEDEAEEFLRVPFRELPAQPRVNHQQSYQLRLLWKNFSKGAVLTDGQLKVYVREHEELRFARPEEFSVEEKEDAFLLNIANAPQTYRLEMHARQHNGRGFRRRFAMQVDEYGRLLTEFTGRNLPADVLSGRWTKVDDGHYVQWKGAYEHTDRNVYNDGPAGVVKISNKHVFWVRPNGSMAFGQLNMGKIDWRQHIQPTKGLMYNNHRAPAALVFQGDFFYLGTYGNGIYVGRIVDNSVEWLAHYDGESGVSPYVSQLAIRGQTLAIGSHKRGLTLAVVDGQRITPQRTYNRDDFPQAESNHITTLFFNRNVLLWSSGYDGVFAATVERHQLGEVKHYRFPDNPLDIEQRVTSARAFGDVLLFGTNDGGLSLAEIQRGVASLDWSFFEHSGNDSGPSAYTTISLVLKDKFALRGSNGDGVRIGKLDGDRFDWSRRYTRKNNGKLLGDSFWGMDVSGNSLVAVNENGLNSGLIYPWHHWVCSEVN